MKANVAAARKYPSASAGLTLDHIASDRSESNREFSDLSDCFLSSLGGGLMFYPDGLDQGVMSIAVRHARIHGHNNVRLSQLNQYILQERLAE